MSRLSDAVRGWYRRRVVGIWLTALATVLIVIYLIPSIVVTIPAGHAGVKWRRFGAYGLLIGVEPGTVTDRFYGEGVHLKWPWDLMHIYNTRLQDVTRTFGVIARDGLMVQAELSIRFRPLEPQLGNLHKYVGPDFIELLVVTELGAHARKQMAQLTPEEIYTTRRAEVEHDIYENLIEEFEVRFLPSRVMFGNDAHLRRRILALVAAPDRTQPLTTQAIAAELGIQPAEVIQHDLDELASEGLVHTQQTSEGTFYRINSEQAVDTQHLNQMLGEGRPLIYVEDVLIRHIQLPGPVAKAIEDKIVTEQEMKEYDFRILREQKERERKRIEAEGIRQFQDIVREGISDRYLKWKGIDATLELARSPNSKIVVIGSAGDGLPIILGPLETAPDAVRLPPPASAAGTAPSSRAPDAREAEEAPAGTPSGSGGNGGTPATGPPAGRPQPRDPREAPVKPPVRPPGR